MLRKLAYVTAFVVAAVSVGLIHLLRYQIPLFFGSSLEVAKLTGEAFPLFAIGLLFTAYLRITTSYFYAIGRNGYSYVLVYGEPIFLFLFLLVLPPVEQLMGVWLSSPLSQLFLMLIGMYFYRRQKKEEEKDEKSVMAA